MIELFRNVTYLHPYIVQLYVAEMMFFVFAKRRNHFVFRVLGSFFVFAFAAVFLLALIYPFASGFLSMAVYVLSLAVFPVCFNVSFMDSLFCCTAGLIVQNTAYNIGIICCAVFGIGWNMEVLSVILQILGYVIVYGLAFFLCAIRIRYVKEIAAGRVFVLVIALSCNIITYTLQWLLSNQNPDNTMTIICRLPFVCANIMALVLMFSMVERTRLREEKTVLQQLLAKNNKQYEMSKNNIEIINRKCHDLKNQIAVLRTNENKQYLEEIEQNIMLYDKTAKTGNTALDITLSEKYLLCEEYRIHFTYIADGDAIGFMDPVDIATLFGNALDNAIEYLATVDDIKKRMIWIKVFSQNDFVSVHIENYFKGSISLENGLPSTSKSDKGYHGFGLKSIRFIAEKYNGTCVIATRDDLFVIDIVFPKSS